jgi:outer membrane protein TolC
MRSTLAAVAFAILGIVMASAQAPLTLDALQSAAKSGNLDLQKAGRTLAEAEKNIRWESELSNAKASVSGGFASPDRFSGQVQLTVPIIPQVSVGASVSSSGNADATLSVSPFAAWRASYQQRAAYRKAQVALTNQTAKLGYDVESAAYGVMQAQANLTLAKAKLALEVEQANVAQKAYDLGELTYENLETARSELVAARQSGFDAERGLLNSRVQLYRLLGPAAGVPEVREVPADELLALIPARDAALSEKRKAAPVGSLALRQAEINLESLREQLAATPVYRPNLGLSGRVSYTSSPAPGSPEFSGSGSVSLSFSPSEIKTDDRASISRSIAEAERDIELERMALRLQASIADQALAVARQVLESRRAELLQAETAHAEARLLLEQGERTSLEIEQSRISMESARMRLFQAAAGVLDAQAEILLSYLL